MALSGGNHGAGDRKKATEGDRLIGGAIPARVIPAGADGRSHRPRLLVPSLFRRRKTK
jgi:hypothetical protein